MAKPCVPNCTDAGIEVASRGARCTTCAFYKGNSKCGNRSFISWDGRKAKLPKNPGSPDIPTKPSRYCCNWYAPE